MRAAVLALGLSCSDESSRAPDVLTGCRETDAAFPETCPAGSEGQVDGCPTVAGGMAWCAMTEPVEAFRERLGVRGDRFEDFTASALGGLGTRWQCPDGERSTYTWAEEIDGSTCERSATLYAYTASFGSDGSIVGIEETFQPPNCSGAWCCGGRATGRLVWGAAVEWDGCEPAVGE